MEQHKTNSRAIFGLIMIAVGFVLIISHFGILPYDWRHILISWQALLILIGTLMLFSKQNQMAGGILILVGGFFMIPRLVPVSFEWKRLIWPVLLLGIGSIIILREVFKRKQPGNGSPDSLDIVSIFGGGDRNISSQNFEGGKITAIFGGGKLDLRKARLAPGVIELDMFLIFGGYKLILPPDWTVRMEISTVFGGFSDKRQYSGTEERDPGRELVVKGIAIFGGGDLVSY